MNQRGARMIQVMRARYEAALNRTLELLPQRELRRAEDIATAVYRHVACLRQRGHRIDGEAAVGYMRRDQ